MRKVPGACAESADKQARVTMENEVADEVLCNAVTEAGYDVKGCKTA